MIGQLERIIELKNLKPDESSSGSGKIISISSGKGGTGKTFFSVNLAYLMSKKNYKILLVDFDFNMGNVCGLLDFSNEPSVVDFIQGRSLFKDLPQKVNENFYVIPGDSGADDFPALTNEMLMRIKLNLMKLTEEFDFILLDTASGVEKSTIELNNIADLSLIIATPEPTAVMDAYAIVKIIKSNSSANQIAVVINKCISEEDSDITFQNLSEAAQHFINAELKFAGSLTFSLEIHKSITAQKILAETNANCNSITELSSISEYLIKFAQVVNNNHPANKVI